MAEQNVAEAFEMMCGNFESMEAEEVSKGYLRRIVHGANQMVCLVDARPGWVTKLHQHAADETIYMIKGTMRWIVGGKEVTINPGDVLYIPPNTPHEGYVGETGMQQIKIFSPPRQEFIDKTDFYLRGN